jgi:hypothetical protein
LNAFKKHDGQRYLEHCAKALNASIDVKMHAGVLYPHEIWDKYSKLLKPTLMYNYYYTNDVRRVLEKNITEDISLEAMWKNLADMGDCGNTMVVVDGSGSMLSMANGVIPINVSRSLGVYFAERCKGEFHNILMEFSHRPKLIDLNDCETLKDKVVKMSKYDDCTNTDIEAVFMLILQTAVDANMKQSDLPDRILIVSDMEFDNAINQTPCMYGMKALFAELADRYAEYGYKLPKLVFWNVNSRTKTIPMTENELGVVLISGFSPNILSMVMSDQTDPWLALKDKLDSNRYICVSDTLKTVRIND